MSIVVVAEKPSVARDIARVLSARKKAEGYLEGNGYAITWALGHLVHFAQPDEYGSQWSGRWSVSQLPMIPERWRLKTERSTAKQFHVVKRLINDAGTEQVVCATDAGREGENIFRLIYEHARCRKPVQRLWVCCFPQCPPANPKPIGSLPSAR
jgi:DNA topoisomerase-3